MKKARITPGFCLVVILHDGVDIEILGAHGVLHVSLRLAGLVFLDPLLGQLVAVFEFVVLRLELVTLH